jgi:hypothetical protein
MNGIKGCYAAENFLTLIIILEGRTSHLALWLFAMIAIVKFRLPMNGYISKIFDTYVEIALKQWAFLSLQFSNFLPPIVATYARFWE